MSDETVRKIFHALRREGKSFEQIMVELGRAVGEEALAGPGPRLDAIRGACEVMGFRVQSTAIEHFEPFELFPGIHVAKMARDLLLTITLRQVHQGPSGR